MRHDLAKQIILGAIVLFTVSCPNPVNQNTNAPKATPIYDNTLDAGLKTFLEKNYKDWVCVGMSDEDDAFEDGDLVILHLTKSDQEKTIFIRAKTFQKADGHFYWMIIEAPRPAQPPKE